MINGRRYSLHCRSDLPVARVSLYATAGEGVPSEVQAWTVDALPAETLLIPQLSCVGGRMYALSAPEG